jgi:hypothetical protein
MPVPSLRREGPARRGAVALTRSARDARREAPATPGAKDQRHPEPSLRREAPATPGAKCQRVAGAVAPAAMNPALLAAAALPICLWSGVRGVYGYDDSDLPGALRGEV